MKGHSGIAAVLFAMMPRESHSASFLSLRHASGTAAVSLLRTVRLNDYLKVIHLQGTFPTCPQDRLPRARVLLIQAVAACLVGCSSSSSTPVVPKSEVEKGLDDTYAAIRAGDASALSGLVSKYDADRAGLTPDRLKALLELYQKETKGLIPGPVTIQSAFTKEAVATDILRKDGRDVAGLTIFYSVEPGDNHGACVSEGLINAIAMAHANLSDLRLISHKEYTRAKAQGLPEVRTELNAIGIDQICGSGPFPCYSIQAVADEDTKLLKRWAKAP